MSTFANRQSLTARGLVAAAYCAVVPFDALILGSRSLPALVGAAYVVVTVLTLGSSASSFRVPKVMWGAQFGLLTWSVASYFWSIDQQASLTKIATLCFLLVLFHLCVTDLARWPGTMLGGFSVGCSVSAVYTINAQEVYVGRRAAFGDPNELAIALALGVVVTGFLALEARRRVKLFWVAGAVIQSVAIIATGSRAGLIALVLGVALLMMNVLKARSPAIKAGALAVLLLGGRYAWTSGYRSDRLLNIEGDIGAGALSGREEIWARILESQNSPIGVGVGADRAFLEQFGLHWVAHNVFLGTWVQLGAIGIVLIGALYFASARLGIRGRYGSLCLAILPVITVGAMTLSLEHRRIFWLWMAIGVASWMASQPTDNQSAVGARPRLADQATQSVRLASRSSGTH